MDFHVFYVVFRIHRLKILANIPCFLRHGENRKQRHLVKVTKGRFLDKDVLMPSLIESNITHDLYKPNKNPSPLTSWKRKLSLSKACDVDRALRCIIEYIGNLHNSHSYMTHKDTLNI